MFVAKELNSSFAEIDNMQLELLFEFINVYNKIHDTSETYTYIEDIL